MSELTKKPRTKQELATITVEGPVSRRDEAIRLLKELGYELTADGLYGLGFDAESLLSGQGFPAQLEHDSAVSEFIH